MNRTKQGLTLIEILIVMVIISIVAGVAVVTINKNERRDTEMFAKQLANTLSLAEQEAMLEPATLSLAFSKDSYRFYRFTRDAKTKRNTWVVIEDAPLKSHPIPDNLQVTLKIKDVTLPNDNEPHLIISPSGDWTPFVILIGKKLDTPYYQIIGKASGEVISEAYSSK